MTLEFYERISVCKEALAEFTCRVHYFSLLLNSLAELPRNGI